MQKLQITARQVVYRSPFTLAFLANTLNSLLIERRRWAKKSEETKEEKRGKGARNGENRSTITETKGFNSLQTHSNFMK